jgi:hypothetical protein
LRVDLSPASNLTDLKNQGEKFLKGKVRLADRAAAGLDVRVVVTQGQFDRVGWPWLVGL